MANLTYDNFYEFHLDHCRSVKREVLGGIPVMMMVKGVKSKPFVTSSAVVLDPKPLAPIDPSKYHTESFTYSYVNTPCGAIICSTNFISF